MVGRMVVAARRFYVTTREQPGRKQLGKKLVCKGRVVKTCRVIKSVRGAATQLQLPDSGT